VVYHGASSVVDSRYGVYEENDERASWTSLRRTYRITSPATKRRSPHQMDFPGIAQRMRLTIPDVNSDQPMVV
jgi:hypothetical protein